MFDTKTLFHTSGLNTILAPQFKEFSHALGAILKENGEEFKNHGAIAIKHPEIATEDAIDYWHKKFTALIGRDFNRETMYAYQTHIDAEELFRFLSDLSESDEGRQLLSGYVTVGIDPDLY